MSQADLDFLLHCIRFPSISTSPEHRYSVAECAAWLRDHLESCGLEAHLESSGGHPLVWARTARKADRPTVLIYGHYDVQPVDPLEEWTSAPFEPRLAEGRIWARGASDNKGQIMAHVRGVAHALAEDGDLPVNVIFVIEGEEEIGSTHLEEFLQAHREELRCDVAAISDTGMVAPGVPTFTYGLRGICSLELRVTGPATDLHSGIFGGAVVNPATVVARLLATLHDAEGRVAVAGFYDDVRPLEKWERDAWAQLPLDDAAIAALTGVPALDGERGYSAVERIWGRPTVEVNGIGGGFQGEGSKTVIPREAFAKLTCRLVPGQSPEKIADAVTRHLEANCPRGVKIAVHRGHGGEPFVTDPHSRFGKAAQRALRETFGREPALVREGGSIPIVQTFHDVLGVEVLLLGLALPDANAHAPNENFPIANFEAGMHLNRALLRELASAV
jgi:acetylornithine deacetylase/succinyl-diaminopimelate desuccinylase-like protein